MKNYSIFLKLSILGFIILNIACDRREIINNDPKEINVAKNFATSFYKDLDKFDTIKISKYLSNNINKEEFNKALVNLYNHGGNRLKVNLNKIETITEIFNKEKTTTYNIEFIVKYEKLTAIETLSFFKKDNSQMELTSYSFESK